MIVVGERSKKNKNKTKKKTKQKKKKTKNLLLTIEFSNILQLNMHQNLMFKAKF